MLACLRFVLKCPPHVLVIAFQLKQPSAAATVTRTTAQQVAVPKESRAIGTTAADNARLLAHKVNGKLDVIAHYNSIERARPVAAEQAVAIYVHF